VAVDCGRALDVAATEARVHGAAARAVGLVLEAEGAPAATDLPESAAVLVPGEGGAGPFGSKDLGGAPDAAAVAALVNAVARAAGGRIEALPATPERVLLALDAQRDGSR
jgi:CO/xanthine dehydrogenase Mo-binding subunit